ncbi:DUF4214 domain-containing protein [Sulfitobacter dubius]|uniref:Metalloprotease AprA n=1 Tax=Sulfitobacter dubius TaxID=218673 RepID=A0ABY3ZQX6_9RHOB|nr:DUF4214 domain-containing protein [Sulfitobacter dubius]UOA16569.1 Metalloprotease AprA [Sulfitobacter dubius]
MTSYFQLSDTEKSIFLNENWSALDSGYRYHETTVTYSFLTHADGRQSESYLEDAPFVFETFSPAEQQAVRFYLGYIESFTNLTFEEVGSNDGQMGFGFHNMEMGGYASYPFRGDQGVFLNVDARLQAEPENFHYILAHEIGHAVGLSHTWEGQMPAFSESVHDMRLMTALSYNSVLFDSGSTQRGFVTGFQALDIAALQNIYGTRITSADNVFAVNEHGGMSKEGTHWNMSILTPTTLVDTGGTDTVDASGLNQTGPAIFDFRKGLFLDTEQAIEIYDWDQQTWSDPITPVSPLPRLQIQPGTVIEHYIGTSGVDLVIAGYGNQIVNGGGGIDTVSYSGHQNSYTLTLSAQRTTLTDRRPDQNGTDTLADIEFLSFDTGIKGDEFDLSLFGGAAGLAEADMLNVVELYIAYFNRAPDAMGLNYWGTEFSKGYTLPEMAESFFVQSETRSTYETALDADGTLTDVPAFVAAVYTNVLGRAADQSGFDYWVNELQDNPDITAGIFILAILNGAKHPSNPSPQSALDQQYLETKTDVGAYFAVIKGMSDVDNAIDVMSRYNGSQAGVDAAINAADSFYASALDATNGDFLMPLVGVLDDPFAIA